MPTCPRCDGPLSPDEPDCPRCGAPAATSPESLATRAMTTASTPRRPASDPSSLGHGRFEPGTRLGTRYRIVGLLGRGGMGEVYRADDLELGQSVALKFLPSRVRHDPDALARFRNEVRVARQIAHPNVARVYDLAEADGELFLTMEYVDGEDLASVLRRMGRPSRDKAIEIARQLCLGLAAAHERGVLHRDLKPSNVMIDGRGRVRIMDFGLAALAEQVSAGGEIVGTPAYMAPEQLESGQVSVQSDLYALGLVLHELGTGRRLHDTGDLDELRRRHASGAGSASSSLSTDIDPAFERIVQHCLETDPRMRPASAYAVLGALPGGDPLAAALAAGETPSPELVAHAGESRGIAPRVAVGLLVAALVALCTSMWLSTPHVSAFRQSPAALSFKAGAALEALGHTDLPRHTASGFAARAEWIERLTARRQPAESLATAGPGAWYFWRRYAPAAMDPRSIHRTVVEVDDPRPGGPGTATVLLDVDGRLIGLQVAALPGRDSVRAARGDSLVDWAPLLRLAALDPARLTPDPRPWLPPVACDTTVAWTTPAARPALGTLRVRAGALDGRVVYFTVLDSLGSATDALGVRERDYRMQLWDWVGTLVFYGTLLGSIVLMRRNVKQGRGDRRGALRLGLFVLVVTALESVFTWSVPQRGLLGLFDSLTNGRALGHAFVHASQMWLAYMAIEPYVRRLWPRMLVSWARLASGRVRDPLVGRDVLVGMLLGAVASVLLQGMVLGAPRLGVRMPPDVLSSGFLASFGSLGGLGYALSYFVSVTVLDVLTSLLLCLIVHLAFKRTEATIGAAFVIQGLWTFGNYSSSSGPVVGVAVAVVVATLMIGSLFRFGLLTTLAAIFVSYVLTVATPPFDPSSWYGARGLVLLAVVGGLAVLAAWTAMAGEPLFADVLQERRPERA